MTVRYHQTVTAVTVLYLLVIRAVTFRYHSTVTVLYLLVICTVTFRYHPTVTVLYLLVIRAVMFRYHNAIRYLFSAGVLHDLSMDFGLTCDGVDSLSDSNPPKSRYFD